MAPKSIVNIHKKTCIICDIEERKMPTEYLRKYERVLEGKLEDLSFLNTQEIAFKTNKDNGTEVTEDNAFFCKKHHIHLAKKYKNRTKFIGIFLIEIDACKEDITNGEYKYAINLIKDFIYKIQYLNSLKNEEDIIEKIEEVMHLKNDSIDIDENIEYWIATAIYLYAALNDKKGLMKFISDIHDKRKYGMKPLIKTVDIKRINEELGNILKLKHERARHSKKAREELENASHFLNKTMNDFFKG